MRMRPSLAKILCAAIPAMACIPAAQAQSSVTIYGLVDAALEHSRTGVSLTRLVPGGSMGSRLGFRGVEDLGGGLGAVFRLEMGLLNDEGGLGQGGRAFGRESSVGLTGPFGAVHAGRLPTPHYVVSSGIDAFQWMGSGGLLALTRSESTTKQVFGLAVNARHDNAIGYVSPRWGGLEARAMYSLSERQPTLGSGYGASLRYAAGPLDALIGYTRQNAGSAGTGRVDGLVAGGSYNFGAVRLFAGYSMDRNDCTNCRGALTRVDGAREGDFRVYNVGARVPMGAFVAIAQVARVQDRSDYALPTGDRDATWWALGGEYSLSKRTVLYGSVGSIGNQNGSRYVLGTGTAQLPAGLIGSDNPRSTTVGVGVRHLF